MTLSPVVAKRVRSRTLCLSLALLSCAGALEAQTPFGSQQRTQKISQLEGGFGGVLSDNDSFGSSCAAIGDVDGDGNDDLAVGARDNAAGPDAGRVVWILFLEADGTVREETKLAAGAGGLGTPGQQDIFGSGLAALGDLDGDGVPDLAVGNPESAAGGPNRGAVRLFLLNADGTFKSFTTISSTSGGLSGTLDDGDSFGASLAVLEPTAAGAVLDLAVGATGDDDGGPDRGAVWVLSLAVDGSIVAERKIASGAGGFGGALADGDAFGASLAALTDLDGDGRGELAVGATGDDDGGSSTGAVWVLFRDAAGLVQAEQKIGALSGGFAGPLSAQDNFGAGLATLGDLDGDGVGDLAAGAPGDDDGGNNRGAVWLLFLNSDGTVRDALKLSEADAGFAGTLADGDLFGAALGFLVDLDANGLPEIVVGAPGDDDGGTNHGAVYVVFFQFPDEIVNNGSGINPLALAAGSNPPQIGTIWDPFIDDTALPFLGGISFNIIGVSSVPLSQGVSNLGPNIVGELLIDLSQLQLAQTVAADESFAIPIPFNVALVGLDCSSQGVVARGTTYTLTNRLDVVIGFPPAGTVATKRAPLARSLQGGVDRGQ